MRISDWSSDVCSSDLADDVGVSIFGLQRIIEAGRRLPAQRQASELLLGFGIVMVGRTVIDIAVLLDDLVRSEEHTSELQSLMRISYAVFCLKKKKKEQHI